MRKTKTISVYEAKNMKTSFNNNTHTSDLAILYFTFKFKVISSDDFYSDFETRYTHHFSPDEAHK